MCVRKIQVMVTREQNILLVIYSDCEGGKSKEGGRKKKRGEGGSGGGGGEGMTNSRGVGGDGER